METISISNQKGGTAKSTTTINLSAALAELGKKVLVIDIDQQGSTSNSLGVVRDNSELGSFAVIAQGEPLSEHIYETTVPGVDIVPAHLSLAMAENAISSHPILSMNPMNILKEAISKLPEGFWDYIIIDCPPALGVLSKNALVASKRVLIPVETQFMPMEGVAGLLETLKHVQQGINPELEIFGVLAVRVKPKMLDKSVVKDLQERFGSIMFETLIKENTHIAEAPSFHQSVLQYAPKSPGAKMYRELAKEFLARIEQASATTMKAANG